MTSATTDLRVVAEQGAALLGPDATAQQVLAWAGETFGHRMIVASNMQDAVLVDLAAKALSDGRARERPSGAGLFDVLFLETGYHFPETIGTRDAVAAVYDVTIPRPRRIDSTEVATLAATITDQLREEGSRGRRDS